MFRIRYYLSLSKPLALISAGSVSNESSVLALYGDEILLLETEMVKIIMRMLQNSLIDDLLFCRIIVTPIDYVRNHESFDLPREKYR